MSKTALRKLIAGFDAPQLRELLLDIYSRSRDAKEILDFYSDPDIPAKLRQYSEAVSKEVHRTKRHRPAPRMREIRAIIKRFNRLDPGDDATATLMAETIIEFCSLARTTHVDDKLADQMAVLLRDTLDYLSSRRMIDEYGPQLHKQIASIRPGSAHCYVRHCLSSTLADYNP